MNQTEIEEIQGLEKRIEELEKENQALKREISQLEHALANEMSYLDYLDYCMDCE